MKVLLPLASVATNLAALDHCREAQADLESKADSATPVDLVLIAEKL